MASVGYVDSADLWGWEWVGMGIAVSCVAFKLNNANKKYTNKSIIVVVTLA